MAFTEKTVEARTNIFTSEKREVRQQPIIGDAGGYVHGELVTLDTDGVFKKCTIGTDTAMAVLFGDVEADATEATVILSGSVNATYLNGVTSANVGGVRNELLNYGIVVEKIDELA